MKNKGNCLYEELTKSHIDDVTLRRKGRVRREGNRFSLLIWLIGLMACFIIFFCAFFGPIKPKNEITSRAFIALSGLLLMAMVIRLTRVIFFVDNLKIYSNGITLPNRGFRDYLRNNERFIPFNEIKEILIEEHRNRISIVRNNGSKEKFCRDYVLNIDEFEALVGKNVKLTHVSSLLGKLSRRI